MRYSVLLDFIDQNGEVDTIAVTRRWSHRKASADAARLRATIEASGLGWTGDSMGQVAAYVRRARTVRDACSEIVAFARLVDKVGS